MVAFGSFDSLCSVSGLTLCPLVGPTGGIEPVCYARNIELGSQLLFEPSVLVIHALTLVMTIIMIIHISGKYTAIGQKEILIFFQMYVITTFVEFLTVSGLIPLSSGIFPYATAIYLALAIATFWCLFVNGLVPFQIIEDGTVLSLWVISSNPDNPHFHVCGILGFFAGLDRHIFKCCRHELLESNTPLGSVHCVPASNGNSLFLFANSARVPQFG